MDAGESAVEFRRHVNAAREMVFATFADRSLVSRWLNLAKEVRLDVLTFECRVGGVCRFAYQCPDGQIMHVNSVFSPVEPPTGLIFS